MPELLAILGHEIGHWKLWHTLQGFVISQVCIGNSVALSFHCLYRSYSFLILVSLYSSCADMVALCLLQAYVFALFLAFSFMQTNPGLFAAFGFAFDGDQAQHPVPVFVGR